MILRRIPILATWSGGILATPPELLSIWFFSSLVIRISRRLIDRFKVS